MATPALPDGSVSPAEARGGATSPAWTASSAPAACRAIAALAYGTESDPAGRQDLRAGQHLRHDGQEAAVRRSRHRRHLRPVRDGRHRRRATPTPASSPPTCWPAPSTTNWRRRILITDSRGAGRRRCSASSSAQLADTRDAEPSPAHAWRRAAASSIVDRLKEALELASEFAPEHLCLHVRATRTLLDERAERRLRVRGRASGGVDRRLHRGPQPRHAHRRQRPLRSPLGVHDFLKVTSLVSLDRKALAKLGPPAAAIARAEGLTGHARAIERRLDRGALR